jgi:hypothetical protein
MMQLPAELLPVVQITLPIVAAIFVAAWLQNRRIDDIQTDLRAFRAEMRSALGEIREELARHGERLARLEERNRPRLEVQP